MEVKIKKLSPKAVIPAYAHTDGDMGMDITATDCVYDPVYDRFIYHTGLAFEVPKGYGMLIFPRSSNCKTNAYLCNSVGILDSNYRGELMFMYKNRTDSSQLIPIKLDMDLNMRNLELVNEHAPYKVGDRIGQIVIIPYPEITFKEVNELSDTDRGEGGFGSTNK